MSSNSTLFLCKYSNAFSNYSKRNDNKVIYILKKKKEKRTNLDYIISQDITYKTYKNSLRNSWRNKINIKLKYVLLYTTCVCMCMR